MADGTDRTFAVAVVDDNEDVRQLLKLRVDFEHDLEWLGEAADGVAGMSLVLERQPDAVILNVDLPRLNGLDVLGRVRAAGFTGVVVVYTASSAALAIALAGGADAALHKTRPVTALLETVTACCRSSA
jgi:DNA-binding NarL/FixJ family response regulator